MGAAVVAIVVICYFLRWYDAALAVLGFCLLNSILAAARAFIDPQWYFRKAFQAGVVPSYPMLLGSKLLITALTVIGCWFIAHAAGHL